MDEIKNKPATPSELKAKQDRRECFNCGKIVPLEGDETYRRGLCDACYQFAYRLVNIEQVTDWDGLEKRGAAAPASKGGRPRKRMANTLLDRIADELLAKTKAVAKAKRK